MNQRYFKIAGIIILIVFAISSCKNALSPTAPQIVFPTTGTVHYTLVQELFTIACDGYGCHNSSDNAGNLDLSGYGTWITDPGVIIPGDTTHSVMVQIIEGKLSHAPGPLISIILTPNQIQGLKTWIEQGAKAN